MKDLICLGIESTAHTFGIGIVTGSGKILADEKDVYKPKLGSGIIPREAAEHHISFAQELLQNSLRKARIKLKDIDMISFSMGPGLPPCLQVGAAFARYLSLRSGKPLVGVNHPIGHIEIGKLTTAAKDPVIVYLSGGNTQIIAFVEGRYRIFGETEDIPVGNALDVVAREFGLIMPGGPEIEKLAKGGKYINFPYVVKGMDLSFTGIVTEAVKKFKSGISREDICYSIQETTFAMLTEVSERALAHIGKKEVLLVGGVAANRRLQEMMKRMCDDRKSKFFVVPFEYAMDNGVMIAWTGLLSYKSGVKTEVESSKINPAWRTDQVEIKWT